jgi:PTH1 family peptidyl-tRNA hydrolase
LANTHQTKGSDGGHNGLKNINLILNTNYTRFRFGISDEFKKGKQIDYVSETGMIRKTALIERLEVAYEIIKSLELQDWKIP